MAHLQIKVDKNRNIFSFFCVVAFFIICTASIRAAKVRMGFMAMRRLTPSARAQTMLNNTPISQDDPRYQEVYSLISNFSKQIKQKAPLCDKLRSFERWFRDSTNHSFEAQLDIYFTFLSEDGILYADDRERLVTSENNSAYHNMECYANTKRREYFSDRRCYSETEKILREMNVKMDPNIVRNIDYVTRAWHSIRNIYPDIPLKWALELVVNLVKQCSHEQKTMNKIFWRDEKERHYLFGKDARTVLNQFTKEPLTDIQYESAIYLWIPAYCTAEHWWACITNRAPKYYPAINETIWQRYQEMLEAKETLKKAFPSNYRLTQLAKLKAKIKRLLHQGFDFDKAENQPAHSRPLPLFIKNQLKKSLRSSDHADKEDFEHTCEIATLLFQKLSAIDKRKSVRYQISALVWFLYLTKGRHLLADTKWNQRVSELDLLQLNFGKQNLNHYLELLIALQNVVPTNKKSRNLQRELFLLLTNYPLNQIQDPEFLELPMMKTYQAVCLYADKQVHFDPAILKSYPWFGPLREEYDSTGRVEIHLQIRDWLMTHQSFLAKEKRLLKRDILRKAAEQEADVQAHEALYLETLREMSTLSENRFLGKDHLLHPGNPAMNITNFCLPNDLPDVDSKDMRSYLCPCIVEYLALSLLREELAEKLKSGLDVFWQRKIK